MIIKFSIVSLVLCYSAEDVVYYVVCDVDNHTLLFPISKVLNSINNIYSVLYNTS